MNTAHNCQSQQDVQFEIKQLSNVSLPSSTLFGRVLNIKPLISGVLLTYEQTPNIVFGKVDEFAASIFVKTPCILDRNNIRLPV